MRYTAEALNKLPTISASQTDDLKIESDTHRVWLSRCGVADGMPYENGVTEETLIDGRWRVSAAYPG